jgi:hypothetical protein
MKKQLLFVLAACASPAFLFAQANMYFTNQTGLLPSNTYSSGNAIGVVDMNNDGKDDIVRSDNTTMSIAYQQLPNASLNEQTYVFALSSPWGMCVGDMNNDGYNDAMWGENGSTRVMVWNGSGYTGTNVTTATGAGSIFVQGCNYFDINNDHFLDLFVCNDVAMSHIYVNNGGTGWTFDQSLIPLAQVPVITSDANSGNYASIWSDINNDGLTDLMITHCRQGVNQSTDPRRIDQIFFNNGNGTFTQDTTNWTGLRDGAQGWSTGWGDIDNDGDMDAFVANYGVNSTLMINNGSGVFTNMMATSGLPNTTTYFGENATFQDFDNDGYLDLFVSGDEHYIMKGNGDGTFVSVTNPFIYNGNQIRAHAIGDLNNDGWLDVYSSYCGVYNSPSGSRHDRLWMNTETSNGNTNHWVKFFLTGGATTGMSNKNGVGAIVKIYGPWGVQVREVRSGEGYGIQNSMTVHFGLGAATQIDSAVVIWPSGIVDATLEIPADQTVNLIEGSSPLSSHSRPAQTLELNVYPNPVTDDAVIRLDHFASLGLNNLSVNVYDLNGKVVYSESALQRSIIVLDRKMFSSGMYMVEVTNNNVRVATKKMMVQ